MSAMLSFSAPLLPSQHIQQENDERGGGGDAGQLVFSIFSVMKVTMLLCVCIYV